MFLQQNEKEKKIMQQDWKFLINTKLFSGISVDELQIMLQCLGTEMCTFIKGEAVFRRGEYIDKIALLTEGNIYIQKEDYWGNLSILGEILPGDLFGEVYACLGDSRSLNNAVAVKDSRVLFMDAQKVLKTCPAGCPFHQRLIRNLLEVMAEKNRRLTGKMGHVSQRTTRGKLLSYLSEMSLKTGNVSFEIPFNRQQLADYLFVDRSAMSKELRKMKEEGLLDFRRNHFVLK